MKRLNMELLTAAELASLWMQLSIKLGMVAKPEEIEIARDFIQSHDGFESAEKFDTVLKLIKGE